LLERADVKAQLQAYGVTAEEAAARVEVLSDREVALIAGRVDEVPAGGNPGVFFGAVALLLFAPVAIIVGVVALIAAIVTGAATHKRSAEGVSLGSIGSERAARENFCRDLYLEKRSDWRDHLPRYRDCVAN
jgi:hypothetical protein